MTPFTLLRFLFGGKRAILEIANARGVLVVGFLLVLSAGIARDYDGEDLLHEPYRLLIPVAASLVTSLLLFAMTYYILDIGSRKDRSFWAQYASFLGLYWMTAPLAWLYAIPVEQWLSPAAAVSTNLCLLGVVATWRVALITRVISVLYQSTGESAFAVVMLFADTVLLTIVWLTPIPIVSIMGGIRLTDSELVIQNAIILLRFLGTISFPAWLVNACIVGAKSSTSPIPVGEENHAFPSTENSAERNHSRKRVSTGLWCVAVAAVLFWVPILPRTQPEQINRRIVEDSFRSGRVGEAVQFMMAHQRSDFPRHWDLPPHIGYGERDPPIIEILVAMPENSSSSWVWQIYWEKSAHIAASRGTFYFPAISLDRATDDILVEYSALLKRTPEGPVLAFYHRREIDYLLKDAPNSRRRIALQEILELVPPYEN